LVESRLLRAFEYQVSDAGIALLQDPDALFQGGIDLSGTRVETRSRIGRQSDVAATHAIAALAAGSGATWMSSPTMNRTKIDAVTACISWSSTE
jgi:hypothetical protein